MSFPATDVPLLLLPVRLETRFVGTELWIRIFPDDAHVSAHDPLLSAGEITAGRRYYDDTAGGSPDAALRALQTAVGGPRAAWVVAQLAPYGQWIQAGRTGVPPVPAPRTRELAPRAVALPERFFARGYLGGDLVIDAQGAAVVDGPAVAPIARDGGGPFDAASAWLFDFARAVAQGLALKAPLGPRADEIRASGLTRLVVFGTRGDAAGAGAAQLAALLDAHRYGRGLAFMAPGTPTNLVGAAPVVPVGPPASPASDDRGARLAAALGLDPAALRLELASGDDEPVSRAMNTALWPATWGYFLPQWMGVTSAATLGWARRHFIDHVRAGGPLPAWRVGRQPYGILPVVAPASPPLPDPIEQALASLLATLRTGPFAAAVARVPRVRADAPGTELQQILARPADSRRFRGRMLFGRTHLRNLYQLLRPTPPAGRTEIPPGLPPLVLTTLAKHPPPWTADRDAPGAFLDGLNQRALGSLRAYGLAWAPRLATAVYSDRTDPVTVPLAVADDPMLTALPRTLAELRAAKPTSLLGRLLRHAGLLAGAEAAHRALGTRLDDRDVLDPAMAASPLPWARPIGGITAEQWLDRERAATATAPEAADWREWWRAVERLRSLDTDRLAALAAGTLDLASHRLDAWLTSRATRRLAALRAAAPTGIALGAFGFVEELRPGASDSFGFVHAPSLAHAATGAVLASGYRAHRGQGTALQVDLSSARVRRAREVLASSARRPLGAVLGEALERRLYQAGLGGHVAALRGIAPLSPADPLRPAIDGIAVCDRYLTDTPSTDATLEAFVLLDRVDEDFTSIVNKWQNGPGDELLFGVMRDRRLTFAWHIDGAPAWGDPRWNAATSTAAVPLGRWVHVAVVRAATLLRFFLDGQPAGVASIAPGAFTRGAMPLRIGAQRQGAQRALVGKLKRVRIWSIARTPAELVAAADPASLFAWRPGVIGGWALEADGSRGTGDLAGQREGILQGDARLDGGGLHLTGSGQLDVALGETLHAGDRPAANLVGAPPDLALWGELEGLADTVDAIADLGLAEAVHQWVGGHLERAGEHLARFDAGKSIPATLDVVRTPGRGGSIAHRVLAFRTAPAATALPAAYVRAHGSPVLEAWAAELLGPFARVPFQATFRDAAGAAIGVTASHLGAVPLGALDVVFGATVAGEPALPELIACLRYLVFRDRPAALARAVDVTIELVEPAAGAGVSLAGFLEAAGAVWRLLSVGRPLTAADLAWPPVPAPAPDAALIAQAAAQAAAVTAQGAALAALAQAASPSTAAGREQLFAAWLAGIPGAVPAPTDGDPELVARAARAASELTARVARAATATDPGARIALLLGNGLRVVPLVGLTAAQQGALATALFTDGASAERAAASGWIRQAARVRPAVAALTDGLLCAEAVTGAAPHFEVAQLPRTAGDAWAGRVAPRDDLGRLSIVALAPPGFTAAGLAAGLVIDQWDEAVPAAQQTTGLAFHADAPRAAAPQAMVLAVAPPSLAAWDVGSLAAVVGEALDHGKLRAVHITDLGEAQHFLPALALAHNPSDETVSSDVLT
jgi:hypothetical protein